MVSVFDRVTHIMDVTLVMCWSQLVCKLGRLHVTRDML